MDETEFEKLIVSNIAVFADIIEKTDEFTPIDSFSLRALYPELFELLIETTITELNDILEKNRDNMIYGAKIEKLLSKKGNEFLRDLLSSINECGD